MHLVLGRFFSAVPASYVVECTLLSGFCGVLGDQGGFGIVAGFVGGGEAGSAVFTRGVEKIGVGSDVNSTKLRCPGWLSGLNENQQ